MDLKERFELVVEAFESEVSVTRPQETGSRGFGAHALRVNGSIFAMISSSGDFVVKLPRAKVDDMVSEGVGHRFDANKGRPMKEWLVVDPDEDDARWVALGKEAFAYVEACANPPSLLREVTRARRYYLLYLEGVPSRMTVLVSR